MLAGNWCDTNLLLIEVVAEALTSFEQFVDLVVRFVLRFRKFPPEEDGEQRDRDDERQERVRLEQRLQARERADTPNQWFPTGVMHNLRENPFSTYFSLREKN